MSQGIFALQANVFYGQVRPDEGNSRDDFIPIVGAAWKPTWFPTELVGDYTIRNDVDEEDDWSLTLAYTVLPDQLRVEVGGGKHERVFARVLYTLPLRRETTR